MTNEEFYKYQVEQEKRFTVFEKELVLLKAQLSAQEYRHKLELQKILHEKEVRELKENASSAPLPNKSEVEERNKAAGVLLEYCEDKDTLQKLGYKVDGVEVDG